MSRARLLAAAFGADGTLNTSDVAGLSTVAVSGQYTDLLGKPVLSTVATSGLFADLLSKPTTLSGYGISDALASATAASTYQTILVSGTSIKTVNGNSVLGSGNIQIDGGVTSFNTRTGAVTLSSGDVTTALGYTPYNSSNPSGYTSNTGTVTSVSGTGTVSGLTLTGSVTTSGSLTLGGTLSLTSGNVTTALGYTPPQPTGTGASGTWGISISGNAATATTATNVTAGMPNNTDNYMNFRVMRNSNTSVNSDGMFIGYGNANSGATRIYGAGSTSGHAYIDASGNWIRSDGAVYIRSDNIGSYASGGTPTINVTSSTSFTAVASNHYVLVGGATTVTLPASPAAGAVVWVTVSNGRTDNVIARNGQNINSLAENMTIDQANAGIQLRYADATRGWIFT